MVTEFDLVIIGTGTGSSIAAEKCSSAGWKIAQIDSQPFGGTCALRGCDPKKVLVGTAEIMDWFSRMEGRGIEGDLSINWPDLMKFKRTFTKPMPEKREQRMKKNNITPFHGRARFLDEQTLQVGNQTLKAKNFLLANGAKPASLSIEGFQHLTNSTEFLELEELPENIMFVGGGYISFEFAHIAARAGAKVTIIHRGKRPLVNFDPDLVDLLVEKTRKIGINILLDTEVKAVEKEEEMLSVKVSRYEKESILSGDLAVHGAGRTPDIDDLNVEKANIATDKRGILVNNYLQSVSNPKIYAAGDVVSSAGKPLTPVAGFESHIVASNLLKGNHRKINYPAQPSIVFSIPPLASVGLTEAEAKEKGIKADVNFGQTDSWYSSRRTNETFTGYKTLIDSASGKIIGAHFLGSHAPELVNLFTLAINHGIPPVDLKKTIFAYPTFASDLSFML